MLYLLCPNCNTKLKSKDSTSLDSEVWIKCPVCSELFHPQRSDLDFLAESLPAGSISPTGQTPHQEVSRQIKRLASEIRETYGPRENEPFTATEWLPAHPTKRNFTPFYSAMLITAVAAAFFGIVGLFFYSAGPQPLSAAPVRTLKVPDYEQAVLAADLQSMRNNLRKLPLAAKTIDFKGFESRIYKHFSEKAGSGFCQEIEAVNIYSDNTQKGFKAKGVCLDARKTAPVVSIDWKNPGRVQISIEGQSNPVFVELKGRPAETPKLSLAENIEGPPAF
jgi:Zn-finger nucleic acid-binding protein